MTALRRPRRCYHDSPWSMKGQVLLLLGVKQEAGAYCHLLSGSIYMRHCKWDQFKSLGKKTSEVCNHVLQPYEKLKHCFQPKSKPTSNIVLKILYVSVYEFLSTPSWPVPRAIHKPPSVKYMHRIMGIVVFQQFSLKNDFCTPWEILPANLNVLLLINEYAILQNICGTSVVLKAHYPNICMPF